LWQDANQHGGQWLPADGRKKQDRKDSQLIIRINKADRDAFVDLCETLDTSAAREIRRFIREFTLSHQDACDASGASTQPKHKELDPWPKKRKSKTSKKK
jgi:hypothetical protein